MVFFHVAHNHLLLSYKIYLRCDHSNNLLFFLEMSLHYLGRTFVFVFLSYFHISASQSPLISTFSNIDTFLFQNSHGYLKIKKYFMEQFLTCQELAWGQKKNFYINAFIKFSRCQTWYCSSLLNSRTANQGNLRGYWSNWQPLRAYNSLMTTK